MRTLIIYYSRSGQTRKVAEWFVQKEKTVVEEIVDLKKRSGLFGFIFAGRDAMVGAMTEIEPLKNDPTTFDQIVVVTPTWASTIPPAIRTWLNGARVENCRVGVIATAGGEPPQRIFEDIEELTKIRTQQQLALRQERVKDGNFTYDLENFWSDFNIK